MIPARENSLKTVAVMPSTLQRVPVASSLYLRRSALAVAEHEDARLNGMTRSLDRRLLALNLQPLSEALMKVA